MNHLGMAGIGKRLGAVVIAGVVSGSLILSAPGSSAATAPQRSAPSAAATSSGVVATSDAGTMTSRVTGTSTNANGTIRKVTGTFTPSSFRASDGVLKATGVLKALVYKNGQQVRTSKVVTIPVQSANGTGVAAVGGRAMPGAAVAACDILHLVLGPLDLDLLGLNVHLNKVVLDITAVPGAGALLGNLLCAVAGLLDGGPLGGLLGQLADLLNQILGALNL